MFSKLTLLDKMLSATFVSILLLLSVITSNAYAQTAPTTPPSAVSPAGTTVGREAFKITITNPLRLGGSPITSLEGFIRAVLSLLIVVLTPLVALAIIFAGFQYVTAGGNPTKIQSASRALMYAIIGAILVIGAITLADVIDGAIGQFRKGS